MPAFTTSLGVEIIIVIGMDIMFKMFSHVLKARLKRKPAYVFLNVCINESLNIVLNDRFPCELASKQLTRGTVRLYKNNTSFWIKSPGLVH